MKSFFSTFWNWYERHHKINTAIAAFLFTLQLVHLYWLTTEVVAEKIFGQSFFPHTNALAHFLLIFVDYTEIPAIITTSLVYARLFKKNGKIKNLMYLVFLNVQLIHIFWITDEYVIDAFTGNALIGWTPIFAWIAISIDYLELPVIFATIKEAVISFRTKKEESLP